MPNRAARRAAERVETRAVRHRIRRGTAAAATASLALAGTGALLVGGAAPAGAATITVTSTGDSGPNTLRQALADANDGDTISITATGTINLATTLVIHDFVTISGPGAANLTVSGGDLVRVFDLDGTKTGTGAVTLRDLTIADGSAENGRGLGFNADCAVGSTIDVTLERVAVTGAQPLGATFAADGAGASMGDCHDVHVTDATFTGNTVVNGIAGGVGGGLKITDSNVVTVSGTTFSNNTAATGGGLIAAGNASVTVTGSTFTGNEARLAGGALMFDGNVASSVVDSTFTGNKIRSGGLYAGHGGAIRASVYADGTIAISGSTFDANHALYGGAVEILYGTTTIDSSTFTDNVAGVGGGAVFVGSVGSDPLTITGSTFSGNTADHGGALYAGNAGTLTVANSTFTGNAASLEGSALLIGATTATNLFQSTVSGNHGPVNGTAILLNEVVPAGPTPAAPGRVLPTPTAGVMVVSGSIVAGNSPDTPGTFYDIGSGTGAPTVLGYSSLFGLLGAGVGSAFNGSRLGVSTADLALGALADNGGPTETMAPGDGSIAIDAGPNPVATFPGNTFDQRGTGFARVVGSQADVGAYEVQSVAPPAPTGVTLSALGGRRAHVSWTAPASGPTPDGYQIRCMPASYPKNLGPGGKVVYAGSATTSVDVSDLVGGETYVCYVRARYTSQYFSWLGDGQEGPFSAPSNAVVITRTAPPVPVQVSATAPAQPTGRSTSVSFVEPDNRSGAAVQRYDARCASGNGGTIRSASGTSSPIAVTGLTTGRTYQCVVSAVNSVGASAWSAGATVVVPAGPPTNVRATTPTAAARKTSVSFTAPDGGPTPQRYLVQCRSTDGRSVVGSSAARSPIEVGGLVRGKTYTCTVTAVFPNGNGPASGASNPITVP